MVTLSALWLPILLSAAAVFVVSSVIHMVLQYHKADYKRLSAAGEDALRQLIRGQNPAPGEYMFPSCGSMKETETPEFQKKFAEGPVGMMILRPNGPFSMGKSLGQWFVLCLVISVMVGYLTSAAMKAGQPFVDVFRVAFAATFLGHGFGSVSNSIWKFVGWRTTLLFLVDALLYALAAAGVFAWLWPAAAA